VITRDTWWFWLLLLAGAVITYLLSTEPIPQWGYYDWLKAGAFLVAWIAGKGSNSFGVFNPKK